MNDVLRRLARSAFRNTIHLRRRRRRRHPLSPPHAPPNIIIWMLGRRLQPVAASACEGQFGSTHLQTTFLHAEIHFEAFVTDAKHGLWEPRPLLGEVRPGALRLHCHSPACKRCSNEIGQLRSSYEGLHLEPLIRAVRTHNGRRPFAATAAAEIALLVLPDYENLFHQFGSLAIAWCALQESLALFARANRSGAPLDAAVAIYMLNNASLAPTRKFWTPALSATPPVFVRAQPPPPAATFARVVVVQPTTETWWWNVWKADATDRRALLRRLTSHLAGSLLPAGSETERTAEAQAMAAVASAMQSAKGASSYGSGASIKRGGMDSARDRPATDAGSSVPRWALVINRPPPADRRILNAGELAAHLASPLAPHGLTPVVVDLAALSTRAQLALIRRAGLLVGAHGAGLLWNLFLPDGAPVVELLNLANANQYYANHCRWTRRPYGQWQNSQPEREEVALDPLTKQPLAPFRSHVAVNVSEAASVVRRVLGTFDES